MGMVIGIVVVVVTLYFILSGNLRGKPRGQGISTQPPREAAQLTKVAEVEASGALVEEADKEVLRFFKVPTKGLNQTTARAEVVKLQADPEKAAAWDQRPADPIQKEFYRFFGVKVPRGLTYIAADDYIGKYQQTLDSQQLDDWSSYQSILEDLLDKDTRDSYDIKKPSIATVRAAIEALRQSGMSLSDLEGDLEIVTQKLIELQPELER